MEILSEVPGQFQMPTGPTLPQTFHKYLQSVETVAIVASAFLADRVDESLDPLVAGSVGVPYLVSLSCVQERPGLDQRLEQPQVYLQEPWEMPLYDMLEFGAALLPQKAVSWVDITHTAGIGSQTPALTYC